MPSAILFTHSVLNCFIYHECNINYLKSYHDILKFLLDDKEQKMPMLSHILKHISIRYQPFHDNNRTVLLDLICYEHHEQWNIIFNNHACFFYSFNKRIQCGDPYIDHQSASFIFSATISTSSSNTYPWTASFFMGFTLISISWIRIKQSPWGFHRIRTDI